jgi:hypothetical protein
MKPVSVVTHYNAEPGFEKSLLAFLNSDLIQDVIVVCRGPVDMGASGCRTLMAGPLTSQQTLGLILDTIQTKYLLLMPGPKPLSIGRGDLDKLVRAAESRGAGLTYSDFYEVSQGRATFHPLNDYQPGSVRDDFDFGALMLFSVPGLMMAVQKYGAIPPVRYAGIYDLRLKVSIDHFIHHVEEPLYSVIGHDDFRAGEKIFSYVDPRNTEVQKEMEAVFTDYLKKIGAYIPAESLREAEVALGSFPVRASVIIPVRNRKNTIAEAVKSALAQETDFPYNVIVVDNHSSDGTTAILSELAAQHDNIRHIIPQKTDLGIGGCWNEALYSEACGRYAVQLDSDDLYSSDKALQKIVDTFRQGAYAMVIGSYSLVNFSLDRIPPGLIDHREWTDENGHNNALRINGLGAPRAFDTSLMRKIGFLNVSYGEDYAAALRICREYRIGRIYESLYLCRRWEGNTDAALPITETNRNDAFKDKIRTDEILARIRMNQQGLP